MGKLYSALGEMQENAFNGEIGATYGKPNKNVWQQVYVLAGRQKLLLSPSSVASYHGLAMYAVTINCRKSYYMKRRMPRKTAEIMEGQR